MSKTTILLCKCRSEHYKQINYNNLENQLSKLDADLVVVDDLCAATLTHAHELNAINGKTTIILACEPRAVKHLFIQNSIEIRNHHTINFRNRGTEIAMKELQAFNIELGEIRKRMLTSNLEVPSWYPIIDQERCTACGRCAKFCLFGVYSFTEKKLCVTNPLHCKNNCPACARTCPTSAIIFPKIGEGGVIAGAEPGSTKETITLAPDTLTSRLLERKNLRTSILKPSVIEQAEKEKSAALKALQNSTISKND